MYPLSRARRILKWTGAGLSGLIVTLWLASLRFDLVAPRDVFIRGGVLRVQARPTHPQYRMINWSTRWNGAGFERPRLVSAPIPHQSYLSVPLWLPLLLTAIPTAWLWHRDRRRIRPGCCLRCGYDLTGNTSGVCSECGLAKPPLATL